MNVDTAARSLAETLKLSTRKMADQGPPVAFNQHHLTTPAASKQPRQVSPFRFRSWCDSRVVFAR